MTALAADKASVTASSDLVIPYNEYTIDDGSILYQGATLCVDPDDSMGLKPATAAKPFYYPLGVHPVSKVTGDGTKRGYVLAGLYERENSSAGDAIVSSLPLGWPLYAADDQTAALTNGGGTRAFLGVFGGWSSNGKPLVWIGIDPIGLMARGILIPVVKGHADLTAAATSQTFNLYTLPGPARVIVCGSLDSLTAFSGGGATAVTLAFGIDTGPDIDAIGDQEDIFTGATAPSGFVAGVKGYVGCPLSSGVIITATFESDVNVADLTAGAVVASVLIRPGS